ncbi:MAG: YARHG domain-containing protein [Bacteroidales bacterium]|jgi:hypothetical protein|nr:YARHG domain-containing protein [Bacteroidales bacterium]
MKRYILIIIYILFVFQVGAQSEPKNILSQIEKIIVEKHLIDINSDNIVDTVIFRFPSNYDHPKYGYTDPGVFNILDLRLSSTKNIYIDECFDTIPDKPFKGFDNEIDSKHAFLSYFNTPDKYLFFVGPAYGCCMEQTYIFEIRADNVKLISSSQLSLEKITDYDNDGKIEVIGFNAMGESWTDNKNNYKYRHLIYPSVFSVGDTLRKDSTLTYKYNYDLKEKYGDFLSYIRPIIIKDIERGTEFIKEFKNIDNQYSRKYEMTSKIKLSSYILDKYSKEELRLMRNEIFAAHGYIFKSEDLRTHFYKTKWYKPRFTDVSEKLTNIEKYNIQMILNTEKYK